MPAFIPLPADPNPTIPDAILVAIVRAATRPHLSTKARKFAKPYANRAKELLTEQGD